jgi:hypothetical protein
MQNDGKPYIEERWMWVSLEIEWVRTGVER